MTLPVNYDGDALALVQNAYQNSDENMDARLNQYQRDIDLYNAATNISNRDQSMPHIQLPKMFTIVETKSPRDIKALFGRRPVLSWMSKRDEFKATAQIQVEYVDDLLSKAHLYVHGALLIKMKMLYGLSYMNGIPYYDDIIEKQLVVDPYVGITKRETKHKRLRLKLETWAPWEVLPDPAAINLEDPDGCRYVIKIQIATKQGIKEMYKRGAYPDLDIELLDASSTRRRSGSGRYLHDNWGIKMLKEYGLDYPENDDDIGVILRYESNDRYIDLWNGDIVLRDRDNPFSHKRINLSRMIHTQAPHTANQFHGIGEAKPNEVLIAMLNDTYSLTYASHGLINQPVVFFRQDSINIDDLIWSLGQRIPVDSTSDRPLSDDVMIHEGQGLPKEHYMLKDELEGDIEEVSGLHSVGKGQEQEGGTGTATEVAILRETGDARQEGSIKLGEQMFLADFSMKVASIVEQYSSFADVAESVGEEKAMKMFTANPNDLAGGFNYTFKGSDYVANLMVKQRNLKEIADVLLAAPAVKYDGVARKLLEYHEFDEDDIGDMMYTEEEMQQFYQQQAQALEQDAALEVDQEQYDRGQQQEDRKVGGKRFATGGTKNEAKKTKETRLAPHRQGVTK